ncbi:septum formation family protein, partial [Curtobacterium sp. CT11-133]
PSSASTSLETLQFATTPATPGEHAWTDLAGGECLSPFTNAWAQTYTVVDCQTPHVAQLTARLPVSANQWPGPDALAAQAAEQCQTSAALNASAAAAYGDVQVQGSYAPDQATWDQGDTFISCFVTRSSGETMTGSVAPSA